MPSTYNANASTPNYTTAHQFVLPVDGVDKASDPTVNNPFKKLGDYDHYMARVLSTYRPRMTARSINGSSIILEPFNEIFVDSQQTIASQPGNLIATKSSIASTLSVANVVPTAMAFGNSKTYNVFVRTLDGTPIFVIIEQALANSRPDDTLTWYIGPSGLDLSYRYLFSFRTTGAGAIRPFQWDTGKYQILDEMTTNGGAALTFAATTWIDVTLDGPVYPSMRSVEFKIQISFNPATANPTLSFARISIPALDSNGYFAGLYGLHDVGVSTLDGYRTSITGSFAVGGSASAGYKLRFQDFVNPSTAVSTSVQIIGFTE